MSAVAAWTAIAFGLYTHEWPAALFVFMAVNALGDYIESWRAPT